MAHFEFARDSSSSERCLGQRQRHGFTTIDVILTTDIFSMQIMTPWLALFLSGLQSLCVLSQSAGCTVRYDTRVGVCMHSWKVANGTQLTVSISLIHCVCIADSIVPPGTALTQAMLNAHQQ